MDDTGGRRWHRWPRHGTAVAMNPHHRWTQTDLTDLRRRLEMGEQLDQIADAIGRPAMEVGAMMGRLRLKFRAE